MKYEVSDISDEDIQKFAFERIEELYAQGLADRRLIASEMNFGQHRDRHFTVKTFGNEMTTGIRAHRMNGNTQGLSYNEYYSDWRTRVLSALSSSSVPSYLRLSFLGTAEVLVGEEYEYASDEQITEVALKTFDTTLEQLLTIISKLPIVNNKGSAQNHTLSAELIEHNGRPRLAIVVDGQRFIAKKGLRPGYPPSKVAKKLFATPDKTLKKEALGLGKTRRMSDIAQEIGFRGLVHEKLLVATIDSLRLRTSVMLTADEKEIIGHECQSLFDME